MPSTRKQKAKERRSRQLDIMSNVENVVVMLGNYSTINQDDDSSEAEINLDSESSRPLRTSDVTGKTSGHYLQTVEKTVKSRLRRIG